MRPFQPMPLTRRREPFDHTDWLFELKYDGFRALAFVRNGTVALVSRRGIVFRSFPALCTAVGAELFEMRTTRRRA